MRGNGVSSPSSSPDSQGILLDLALIPAFLLIGSVVGFLAGLLGIGGGMTIVPLLIVIFGYEHFPPEHIVHMAIATSMATIVFTSISSVRAHDRHGAVVWGVVWALAPGIVVGSIVGPQLISGVSGALLSGIFSGFAAFSAVQIIRNRKPKPSRVLPGKAALFGVGSGIGIISSVLGAGGAFMSIPFMVWCNIKVHDAVGTSAALGLPIAAAGTVGYIIAGLHRTDMPPYAIGYIYVPGLIAIVLASVMTAPIGARMAHRWPVRRLQLAFAALLFGVATFMLWKAVSTP